MIRMKFNTIAALFLSMLILFSSLACMAAEEEPYDEEEEEIVDVDTEFSPTDVYYEIYKASISSDFNEIASYCTAEYYESYYSEYENGFNELTKAEQDARSDAGSPDPAILDKLENAEFEVNGNKATLSLPDNLDGGIEMYFKYIEGGWFLDGTSQ